MITKSRKEIWSSSWSYCSKKHSIFEGVCFWGVRINNTFENHQTVSCHSTVLKGLKS